MICNWMKTLSSAHKTKQVANFLNLRRHTRSKLNHAGFLYPLSYVYYVYLNQASLAELNVMLGKKFQDDNHMKENEQSATKSW